MSFGKVDFSRLCQNIYFKSICKPKKFELAALVYLAWVQLNLIFFNFIELKKIHHNVQNQCKYFIQNEINRSQYYAFNTYAEYTVDQIENHYIKAMVGFNQEWRQNFACQEKKLHDIVAF